MTASNHLLAGAAIAVSVKQPWLIVPLALASHYAMDALPHFGVHRGEPFARNRHRMFRMVLAADIFLAVIALFTLPRLIDGSIIPASVLLAGMLLAWVPDSVWVYRFFHELKTKRKYEHRGRSDRFHAAIQRESVRGIFVEIACLSGLVAYMLSVQ